MRRPGDSGKDVAAGTGSAAARCGQGLYADLREIREQVARLESDAESGKRRLAGNASFLADGRVVCFERERGDSRYPYGRDGLNFWVYASGYMHANIGAYTLFLPWVEGREPQIAFFAGVRQADETYRPVSLLPVPHLGDHESVVGRRYCVMGHDATYFVLETDALCSALRVFVDQTDAQHIRVHYSILLENRAGRDIDALVSGYVNPFCRHQLAETSEDRWFKQVAVVAQEDRKAAADGDGALPSFVVTVNEDVDRFRSDTNRMLVLRRVTLCDTDGLLSDECTSRREYAGDPRRGIGQARFLRSGRFDEAAPLTVFNDNAIAGDLIRFALPAEGAARFDYVLSVPAVAAEMNVADAPPTAREVDAAHTRVCKSLEAESHSLQMQVEGSLLKGLSAETLNHFVPFLRKQVQVCAETRGYMQASPLSLIGIRDVFQAIEGLLYDQPDAARAKILEAIEYTLVDGRCPRQYSLPMNGAPGKADLREFIDQGVWVISTLYTYVAVTGDADVLRETAGYHQVKARSADGLERADEYDEVIDHLIRIMDYLNRRRDPDTGLLRAMYGDWNDALDGLGVSSTPGQPYGNGVSIMASLQFYQNCTEMIELLERFFPNRFVDRVSEFEETRSALCEGLLRYAVVACDGQRRIVHGWGDRRAYYVGSFRDSDGKARDGLTSNAFWVISGMLEHDATLGEAIVEAFDRLDAPYGLKTFEPGFEPDAPGVGRIPKLPIGTAENGATYVHATAFGIIALFTLGEARRAWEQIVKILPFAPHQGGLSHSPFVMPNSYVYNPALNLSGQNMNDWQTGSSNVLLKLLIRQVFGFQPGLDELVIAPAGEMPFESFDFRCQAHNRTVRIRMTRGNVAQRRFLLNGKPLAMEKDVSPAGLACVRLPYVGLDPRRENVIEITEPVDKVARRAGDAGVLDVTSI